VTFVKDAVVPPAALEPILLCDESLVCCDAHVEDNVPVTGAILQSIPLGLQTMETQGLETGHPKIGFLRGPSFKSNDHMKK